MNVFGFMLNDWFDWGGPAGFPAATGGTGWGPPGRCNYLRFRCYPCPCWGGRAWGGTCPRIGPGTLRPPGPFCGGGTGSCSMMIFV